MRFRRPTRRLFFCSVAGSIAALVFPLSGSVRAGAPVVTVSPTGVKIQIVSASLTQTIDALSHAAGFKVTYEGARPSAMLFGADIETPSVSQTLIKLLDGQNLNYAMILDVSGRKVTSLMVLGVAPKTGGPASGSGGTRLQTFPTPKTSRNSMPPVDDEPSETIQPEPTPEPSPVPAPSPGGPARGQGGPGAPTSPFPPSPFAPRPPFGSPYGARPTPVPSPSP